MIGQKVEVPRMLEHPKAQQIEQNAQRSFAFYHTSSPLEIVELEAFKRSFNGYRILDGDRGHHTNPSGRGRRSGTGGYSIQHTGAAAGHDSG